MLSKILQKIDGKLHEQNGRYTLVKRINKYMYEYEFMLLHLQ